MEYSRQDNQDNINNYDGLEVFLSNTLSGKKDKFTSVGDKVVKMYTCGPTVYDYAHIGNLRAYIFADTLRRVLEWNGYKVFQVMNITDVGHLVSDADEGEDKMTKALKREGRSLTIEAMKEVADFYTDRFKEDLDSLNIERPQCMPKATEHIAEDVQMIRKLESKGLVYHTSDGLYFDTLKFPEYGRLGNVKNISVENLQSRVEPNLEKKNQRDFTLWKFDKNLGWESPWGKGFPGWHIECSAMATKYLGESFDIHTGGIDHIDVHHNNEIAQSEGASGKTFVRYWLHSAHLNLEGEKISKSLGNIIRLKDIIRQGFYPMSYRFLLLGAHYKSPLNFSWESLKAAERGLKNLYQSVANLPEGGQPSKEFLKKFTLVINDDLNTSQALAVVFEVLKSDIDDSAKLATILSFDKVLGLKIKEGASKSKVPDLKTEDVPITVRNLLSEREFARKNKNFKRADFLRDEIKKVGYRIIDDDDKPILVKL